MSLPADQNTASSVPSYPQPDHAMTITPVDQHTIPVLPTLLPRGTTVVQDDPAVMDAGSPGHAGVHGRGQLARLTTQDNTSLPGPGSSSLDPDASPFVSINDNSTQATGTTQRKNKQKVRKNAIPTDSAGVELEFAKLEVSTLQAKVQKQESELKDLRFRNTILMDRNKQLEEAKKNEIHDQYFPSHSGTASSQPSGSSTYQGCHRSQSCCAPPVIYHH